MRPSWRRWRGRPGGWGGLEIASSRELHELLRALERSSAALTGIGLVDPEGRMVAVAARFPQPPVEVADREYFRVHRDAPAGVAESSFVGEVVVSRPREVPVFSLSRPRRDAAGGFDGVIVTAFAPEYFSDFYAQVAESAGDAVALLRLDGALLARSPPAPDWGSRAARAGRALAVATAPPGHGLVTTRSVLDGKERLFAVRRLENYPVAVVYGLDRAVPRAAWLRQLAVIGAVSALAAALLLGLTMRAAAAARRERAAAERAREEAERRAEAEAARAVAEVALREGQRLETLGQIAAGVAHDFRNTVQAVQGGVRLILRTLDSGDLAQARATARLVGEAAGHGGALTERMLAVARRGGGAPDAAALDPAQAVAQACELLRRTLGAGVTVRCEVAAEGLPPRVRGDRAELEAALLNLAVNARDAMPAGGELTVSLAPEVIAEGVAPHPAGLPAGRYARIAVADTGVGMDAATLARATEAFFTTKPAGRGTGLGLSTVRGFAEEVGGALRIESEPGRGTTVTLWLPAAEPDGADPPAGAATRGEAELSRP